MENGKGALIYIHASLLAFFAMLIQIVNTYDVVFLFEGVFQVFMVA